MSDAIDALAGRLRKTLEKNWENAKVLKTLEEVLKAADCRGTPINDVMKAVVRKHKEEIRWRNENLVLEDERFESFSRTCVETMKLVCQVQIVLNSVVEICRLFVPHCLDVRGQGVFELDGFDDEGRTIYRKQSTTKEEMVRPSRIWSVIMGGSRSVSTKGYQPSATDDYGECYLRWHTPKEGTGRACWAVPTNRQGTSAGDWQLDAALVTDLGKWRHVPGAGGGSVEPAVHMVGDPFVPREFRDDLAEVHLNRDRRPRSESSAGSTESETVERVLEQLTREIRMRLSLFLRPNQSQMQLFFNLVRGMVEITRLLGMKAKVQRGGDADFLTETANGDLQSLFNMLINLTLFCDQDVIGTLEERLPKFGGAGKKELVNQCMILNCRLLDLSDIRSFGASWLPRLFHRMCLWSWQLRNPKQIMKISLKGEEPEVTAEDVWPVPQQVRFVAISDTHGWDEDLEIPQGDVLLHCGDFLFEASGLGPHGEIPSDFLLLMNLFEKDVRFQSFKYIFIIGGNHDKPLFDLFRLQHDKLCQLMPPNVIMLQAFTNFPDAQLEFCGAAKRQEVRDCIDNGAVWLKPTGFGSRGMELELEKPPQNGKKGTNGVGWIIAGSGISLANSPWSANGAFQIVKSNRKLLEQAAELLLLKQPDIVMSHGAPDGDWDPDKGDKDFLEQLRKVPHQDAPRIVLFGHRHEHHGQMEVLDKENEGKQILLSAATSSPLYICSKPPIVFDFEARNIGKEASGASTALHPIMKQRESHVPSVWSSGKWCSCELDIPFLPKDEKDPDTDWIPEWFLADGVKSLREEKKAKAKAEGKSAKHTVVAEFDVCGPAVLIANQAIIPWGWAVILIAVAYYNIDSCSHSSDSGTHHNHNGTTPLVQRRLAKECPPFMKYPMWLWLLFLPLCLYLLYVQIKCLRYLILPRIQLFGKGFTIFIFKASFRMWLTYASMASFLVMADITASCFFYAQFLRAVSSHDKITEIWTHVMKQAWVPHCHLTNDITTIFTVYWGLMFTQLIYMILHMFPDEPNGVSYQFQSMDKGYSTWASNLFPFSVHAVAQESDLQGSAESRGCCSFSTWQVRGEKLKFWHADIIKVLAQYGRMPLLVWNEQDIVMKRLAQEIGRNGVRFLQIMFNRLKDAAFRLVLIEVLEKATKLDISVSLFAIEQKMTRDLDHGAWADPLANTASRQMFVACVMSLLSSMKGVMDHVTVWWSFYSIRYNPAEAGAKQQEACSTNWKHIRRFLAVYACFILFLACMILRSAIKLVAVFYCEDALWNLRFHSDGCVTFP